jgi:hypothetical protein
MRDEAIGEELGEEPLDVGTDLAGGDVMVLRRQDRNHFFHRACHWWKELPDARTDDSHAEVHFGLGREQDAAFRESPKDCSWNRRRKWSFVV